mmetsp:Transcript_26046/g.29771  ORF Transcript_26046/g.29771 Transcript_26046/m.29771 type:complete len:568 (-) Transcript_26046:297-2000(-)
MPRANNKKSSNKKKKGKKKAALVQGPNANANENANANGTQVQSQQQQVQTQARKQTEQEKNHAIRNSIQPLDVTPELMSQIKELPTSKDRWYIDTYTHTQTGSSILFCHVFQVESSTRAALATAAKKSASKEAVAALADPILVKDKENQPPIIVSIGSCALWYEYDAVNGKPKSVLKSNLKLDEKHLLLGTLAKVIMGHCRMTKKEKPKRIVLNNSGMMAKLMPELKLMGIPEKYICLANSELIKEGQWQCEKMVKNTGSMNNNDPNFIKYVSETPKPLGTYIPDKCAPAKWYICPPNQPSIDPIEPDPSSKPHNLWGWRTNLELAVVHMDVPRIQQITSSHPIEDIREYCEIRMLLLRMAQQGLTHACQLLLDHCHVSVEGGRADYITKEWRAYQKKFGDSGDGMTPLMHASEQGQYEVCKLLLEYGASVTMKDWNISGTALNAAVAFGHIDVVRLLLRHGAIVGATNKDGMDAIDMARFLQQPEFLKMNGGTMQQYEQIEEILREKDDRCSYCKMKPVAAVLDFCPCNKEKYCNRKCQKKRWVFHKKLHNEVMERKSQTVCSRAS